MVSLIATLPMQLACQLINAGHYSPENFTIVDTRLPKSPTPVLPDGFTPFPDVGMAYRFFAQRMTWNSARKFCIAHESNLAVIDSFRKLTYVFSLRNISDDISTAIGIHRFFGDDDWVSVKTGLPVGTTPWSPGQEWTDNKNFYCVSMWHDGRGLSASVCDWPQYVACEVPLAVYDIENKILNESQLIPN